MGWGLSQEGPSGSCSIPVGDLPTESLLGPDEGSMPGGRAAISFCQLSPGLHHSGGAFLLQPAPPSPPSGWGPGLRARPRVEFAAQCGTVGTWGPASTQCGSPTASISGACGLALHLRVAPAAPTPRPWPVRVQAGKMRPVSREEKPNPLQDPNFCSRLFSW